MALYLNDFNLKILQYRREIYIVMIKPHVSSHIRFRKKKIKTSKTRFLKGPERHWSSRGCLIQKYVYSFMKL